MVFSGSVDCGKSTLVGHLLKILGYVSDREFEKITDDTSKLKMHVIYETVAQRDMVYKAPNANMDSAFNRLEELLGKTK